MNIPTYQEYNGDEQSYKELLSQIIRVSLDNIMLEVHHKQNECTPEQMYDIAVKVRDMSEKGITSYQLAQEEVEKVKRLLHDLTPGGSEFYNDPEYCAKWIRNDRAETFHAAAKIITNLKAEMERLKGLCHKLWDAQYPNPQYVQDLWDKFKAENNL